MMLGFRDYDCENALDVDGCNLFTKYPQDEMYEIYGCLNNKKSFDDRPNNIVENKIFNNWYPLFN